MAISYNHRKLSVTEYQHLRATTGWDMLDDAVVKTALHNDIFSISAYDNDHIIGMGRVIGDGAIYFYIQDVIVHPNYHGQGIGKLIMTEIEKFIHSHANQNSFIGLMAAEGVAHFYTQFGYRPRPENRPGMFKISQKV